MNLRVIKKDIEFLVGDFVDDCILYAMIHEDDNMEEIEQLINEACALANNLFDRANHPDKNAIKAHYKAISMDLLKGLDELCERLSALAKQEKKAAKPAAEKPAEAKKPAAKKPAAEKKPAAKKPAAKKADK